MAMATAVTRCALCTARITTIPGPQLLAVTSSPRLTVRMNSLSTTPLVGDLLAHPDVVLGLHSMPLWMSLVGLAGVNIAGIAGFLAVLRNLQDNSEPLTVVKLQVALLEDHPNLQAKLCQLSDMIQVGQQGAWLIVEEAVLELSMHQSHIAYADVSSSCLNSKKQTYALFGQMATEENKRATREEATVQHHSGDTTDEEGPGLLDMLRGVWYRSREAMVVTLVVAARGRLDIRDKSNTWKVLRHNLQQLTGLSSDKVMAVELLWTPRHADDYLTKAQLCSDYPNLSPFDTQDSCELAL